MAPVPARNLQVLPARSEDALRESEERTRRIIETAHDAFVSIDEQSIVTTWNPQAEATFGWSAEEACGRDLAALLIPERFREAHRRGLRRFLATGEGPVLNQRIELSAMHRDGHEFPVEMTISAMRAAHGYVFNAFLHDISDRKRAERYLRAQHAVAKVLAELDPLDDRALHCILEALGEGMGWQFGSLWEPTPAGELWCTEVWHVPDLEASHFEALTRKLTFAPGVGLPGRVWQTGKPEWIEDLAADPRAPRRRVAEQDGLHGAICLPVVGGGRVIAAVDFLSEERKQPDDALLELMATFGGQIGLFLERREVQRERAHQALHDSLTALPNRVLFLDRVGQCLAQTRRSHDVVAVMFLDVDDFKAVNDSLGHETGDAVLVALAERLRGVLRPEDTVARFGGDEFVSCAVVSDEHDAVTIAERMLAATAEAFVVDGRKVFIGASVGIALGAGTGTTPEALVRDADTAMYAAKRREPGSIATFAPALRAGLESRLRLEGPLREALARHELRIVYQPIVSLHTGAVVEFEALLRWEHADLGPVSPLEFIPVAEDTGLIVPIGRWVLEQACLDAVAIGGGRPADAPRVAVNISPRQLMHAHFARDVRSVLDDIGFPPDRLALEITEGVLIAEAGNAVACLRELKDAGVRLVLDDFGTGYSSLGYVKRFPLDTLKVDCSFTQGVVENPDDRAIVEAIVAMAKGLGLTVVAEGVETEAQAAEVRRLGCGFAQGFLFSRPVPRAQAAEQLAAGG